MSDFLLPILVGTVPVLLIVALAIFGNRRLAGSCGGVTPDGKCSRCGKPAADIPALQGGSGKDCS